MKKPLTLILKLLKWLTVTCLCLLIILIALPFAINIRDEALNESAKKWQAELQQLNTQKTQYAFQTQTLFGFLSKTQIDYDDFTPLPPPVTSIPPFKSNKYLPQKILFSPPTVNKKSFYSVYELRNQKKFDQIIVKNQLALDQYASMLEKTDLIQTGLNDLDEETNHKLTEIGILSRTKILNSLMGDNANDKNNIALLKKEIQFYRLVAEKAHTKNWIILSQDVLDQDLEILKELLNASDASTTKPSKKTLSKERLHNLKDILVIPFLKDITKQQARAIIEPTGKVLASPEVNQFVAYFLNFAYQPQATANLLSECIDTLQENRISEQPNKLYFSTFKALYNPLGKAYHDENCAGIAATEVLENSLSGSLNLPPNLPNSIAVLRTNRLKLNVDARTLFVKHE